MSTTNLIRELLPFLRRQILQPEGPVHACIVPFPILVIETLCADLSEHSTIVASRMTVPVGLFIFPITSAIDQR